MIWKEMLSKFDEIIAQAPGQLSVAIEHLETGEQYFNQADVKLYAASVIKVPIMVAVFDEVHKGRLRLDERIAVQAEDMVTGSGAYNTSHQASSYRLSISLRS